MKTISKYFVSALFIAAFLIPAAFSHAYTFNQPLKPFSSSGEDVSQLQFLLSKEGYFKGNVTGNYGALTVEAVRKYQAKNGLTPDGSVGPKTLAVLNGGQVLGATSDSSFKEGTTSCSKTATVSGAVKYGSRGIDVVTLQIQLDCSGFTDGPNDGIYGKETMDSVAAFQKSMGLVVDGSVADEKTLLTMGITIVGKTLSDPLVTVTRSSSSPVASLRLAGVPNVPFVNYDITANSTATANLTSVSLFIRQVTPAAPIAISNLKLFQGATQLGSTIFNPLVNSIPFQNTFSGFNIPIASSQTITIRFEFDILPTAAGGTIIDTDSALFTNIGIGLQQTSMPVSYIQPLEANDVIIIEPTASSTITLNKSVVGGPHQGNNNIQNTGIFFPNVGGTPVTWGTPITVLPGNHTIRELLGANYTPGQWTGAGCGNSSIPGEGNATVMAGQNTTCTILNTYTQPQITIRLNKILGPGGPVTNTAVFDPHIGTTPVSWGQALPVQLGTTYQISEVLHPSYFASTWSGAGCVNTGFGTGTVTILPNQQNSVECTIMNIYSPPIPARLTLRKAINGGPTLTQPQINTWTLTATGASTIPAPNSLTGISGTVGPVNPGLYTLGETGGLPNYTLTSWFCTGASVTGNVVTITANATVTCTATNTYTPPQPTLRLQKTVTNNNGGTKQPVDWTLTATGDNRGFSDAGNSIVFHQVTAGVAYTLSETGPTGYSMGRWKCDGGNLAIAIFNTRITLSPGQDVTCTINNDDIAPTITLQKTVIGGGPGQLNPQLFNPLIDGNAVVWGQQYPLSPGIHFVSESRYPNYTAGKWGGDCAPFLTGQPGTNLGVTTIAQGDNKVCTITNTYNPPPTLTLVKKVNGTASPLYWTLTATGTNPITPPISGVNGSPQITNANVTPGTYALSESVGPGGYTASLYSCVKNGGAPVSGNSITLVAGDKATCTITNTYIPVITTPCTISTFINPTSVSITASTNKVSVPVSWTTSNCTKVNVEIINGSGTRTSTGIWEAIAGGPSGSHTFTWTVDSRYSGDNTIDVSIVAANNARGEIVSRVNTVQIANVTPYGNQCIFTNATTTPNLTNSTTTLSWSAPAGCKVFLSGWTPDFLIYTLTNPNPIPGGGGSYIFPSTGSHTYALTRSMTFRFHADIQNTPGGIPFTSNSQRFLDVRKQ